MPHPDPNLYAQIASLQAHIIYPLLYRNSVMGFFVFYNETEKMSENRLFQTFRHKVALSVQNYILSERILDNRVYDFEFKSAQRIQKALNSNLLPQAETGHYAWKPVGSTNDRETMLLEDHAISPTHHCFAAISCKNFNPANAMLVYNMVGQLHSLFHLYSQRKTSSQMMKNMFKEIEKTQGSSLSKLSVAVLLFEINQRTLYYIASSINFSIATFRKNGKKNTLAKKEVNENKRGSIYLYDHINIELSFNDQAFFSIFSQESSK